MTNIVAIIPCRGGSKGIPRKNIKPFLGKPLLYWTIKQLKKSKKINDIFVTSDDEEILEVSEELEVKAIKRPKELSTDNATSESVWLHAINDLAINNDSIILAPQVTSPLRLASDFDCALSHFIKEEYDSLFSSSPFEDICVWKRSDKDPKLVPVNYEPKKREIRQNLDPHYVENGSFYLFNCGGFKKRK